MGIRDGNFQQWHKCSDRFRAPLGKNPSNGYPNKLVAPLSDNKKKDEKSKESKENKTANFMGNEFEILSK